MPNAQQLGPVSPDLEHHVLRILGVKNPLDAPDLDPTEYINRLFPNGKRKKPLPNNFTFKILNNIIT